MPSREFLPFSSLRTGRRFTFTSPEPKSGGQAGSGYLLQIGPALRLSFFSPLLLSHHTIAATHRWFFPIDCAAAPRAFLFLA